MPNMPPTESPTVAAECYSVRDSRGGGDSRVATVGQVATAGRVATVGRGATADPSNMGLWGFVPIRIIGRSGPYSRVL